MKRLENADETNWLVYWGLLKPTDGFEVKLISNQQFPCLTLTEKFYAKMYYVSSVKQNDLPNSGKCCRCLFAVISFLKEKDYNIRFQ